MFVQAAKSAWTWQADSVVTPPDSPPEPGNHGQTACLRKVMTETPNEPLLALPVFRNKTHVTSRLGPS